MRERVLVLQHHDFADAASLGEWAIARGFAVDVLHADEAWSIPNLDRVAFVATLGSLHASYDDRVPWLARELELLDAAHVAEVPVLGICFGGQILARSLGARTRRADNPEVGFYELAPDDLGDVPRGPWLFWHDDCFEVPAGATLLGATPGGPAAFRAGASMGLQFHPEVTPQVLDGWIERLNDRLDPATRGELRRAAAAEGDRLRERAWCLYDAFLAGTPGGCKA